MTATADPEGALARLEPVVAADPSLLDDQGRLERAAAIAGASRALASALAVNPQLLDGVPPDWSVPLWIRAMLIEIAGDDLLGRTDMEQATARFSDSMDQLVSKALDRARGMVSERHPLAADVPLAVIAMGKWGARELNYCSDIDLMFVHEPPPGLEAEARSAAIALCGRLMSDLSSPTFEGTALRVDADLRPEGTMGPLSRSLESFRSYYRRWGEPWELQALVKARPAAGDASLGSRFMDLADYVIWGTGLDAEALRSVRLLKARSEEGVSQRDLKRAPGGIRDIEFSVQILQLVHGRFDPDVRCPSTLDALAALESNGYIAEHEASELANAYRFLRDVEHRIQLWDLEQSHVLPDDRADLERIGRSLGLGPDPASQLEGTLGRVRRQVRDLHERLYFRPILDSLAGMASALLDPDAARLRLEALGFRDVTAAARAFEDMTGGLSRKSRVMQQVLPLMLDWLSQSPDPDLGLSQMRLLLANTTDHGALVGLLQTSPVAGERLCRLLGTGKLLGDLIDRIPEFIPRLASDQPSWDIREAGDATLRLVGLIDSRPEFDAKVGTIRRSVRRRKLRIAARDILEETPVESTVEALSDTADSAMEAALHLLDAGDDFAVIAMGKWGGRELSYGSDLDLIYVSSTDGAQDRAHRVAGDLSRVLSEPGRHGEGYQLDPGLRPEGKGGPLTRSVEAFRRYYETWAEPWELLALVRARPVAGDPEVLREFVEVIEPVVWRPRLDSAVARQIRMIKARVESERIPTGEDPDFHLKLGPGGLSDVEFLTQLLQLRHGGGIPDLRLTGTLPALGALHDHHLIDAAQFSALADGYSFLTRVRLRLHLQRGQAGEALPSDPDHLARLAASLGYDRHGELREDYRRHTRRARRVFESLFYE